MTPCGVVFPQAKKRFANGFGLPVAWSDIAPIAHRHGSSIWTEGDAEQSQRLQRVPTMTSRPGGDDQGSAASAPVDSSSSRDVVPSPAARTALLHIRGRSGEVVVDGTVNGVTARTTSSPLNASMLTSLVHELSSRTPSVNSIN